MVSENNTELHHRILKQEGCQFCMTGVGCDVYKQVLMAFRDGLGCKEVVEKTKINKFISSAKSVKPFPIIHNQRIMYKPL
jgi:hypothetical protein